MKSRLAVAFVLVVIIIAFASHKYAPKSSITVCNEPYIFYGDGCCLDSNYNNVCDDREPQVAKQSAEKKEIPAVEEAPASIEYNITSYAGEEPERAEVMLPARRASVTEKQTALEEPYCGDSVCEDRSDLYPYSHVVCDEVSCSVEGTTTETIYSCPRDCGMRCGIDTYVKVGECKFIDGVLVLELQNIGTRPIVGFSFIYTTQNTKTDFKSTPNSEGAYSLKDFSKRIGYESIASLLEPGNKKDYTFQKSEWEHQLERGSLSNIQIIPRILYNDQMVDCSNQRLVFQVEKCRNVNILKG